MRGGPDAQELKNDGHVRSCIQRSGKDKDSNYWGTLGDALKKWVSRNQAAEERQARRERARKSRQAAEMQASGVKGAEAIYTMWERTELKKIFSYYRSSAADIRYGEQMGTGGYHRLLKDSKLLDKAFTTSEADVLYVTTDAASDTTSHKGDLHIDFGDFERLLNSIALAKFPRAPDGKWGEARQRWSLPLARETLLKRHILPHAGRVKEANKLNGLPAEADRLLKRYDVKLRKIFTHYATYDAHSADKTCWKDVSDANTTINMEEFLVFCSSFLVMPCLLSKSQCLGVFVQVDRESDNQDSNKLTYPNFRTCLAYLALEACRNLKQKMQNDMLFVTSTREQQYLKRLLSHLPDHVKRICVPEKESPLKERPLRIDFRSRGLEMQARNGAAIERQDDARRRRQLLGKAESQRRLALRTAENDAQYLQAGPSTPRLSVQAARLPFLSKRIYPWATIAELDPDFTLDQTKRALDFSDASSVDDAESEASRPGSPAWSPAPPLARAGPPKALHTPPGSPTKRPSKKPMVRPPPLAAEPSQEALDFVSDIDAFELNLPKITSPKKRGKARGLPWDLPTPTRLRNATASLSRRGPSSRNLQVLSL